MHRSGRWRAKVLTWPRGQGTAKVATPTREAATDKATASEIYLDIESGHYVFVGPRGRTHIFTADGQHHTSFRTTQANRVGRAGEGKWERIERDELPEELK